MPRTTRSIGTPAALASYSFSIISGSTSEFIFAQMRAGFPAWAAAISASISLISSSRMFCGEITSCLRFRGSR